MKMIFDVILIAILIILVIIGKKKGFVRMILEFLRSIISFFAGVYIAKGLANSIFENVIRNRITQSFTEILAEGEGSVAVSAWNKIPNMIRAILEGAGITQDTFSDIMNGVVPNVSEKVADAIKSAVVPIMVFVLGLLLFVILFVLFGLFIRMTDNIKSVPVIGAANKTLGTITGIVTGIVVVMIICFIAGGLINLSPDGATSFIGKSIEQSYIVSITNKFNPFV